MKDGHPLNSHLEMRQTTSSSKPYVLYEQKLNWVGQAKKSLSLSHWYPGSGVVLDCIDSWSLHPYLLRNTSFIPLRYQRWSSSKQPSWNFSNNFFQPIYSPEQKLDGRHHGPQGQGQRSNIEFTCKCISSLTFWRSNFKLCKCIGPMMLRILGNISCDIGLKFMVK